MARRFVGARLELHVLDRVLGVAARAVDGVIQPPAAAGQIGDDEARVGAQLYHATSEQFHSEFKTDLDIERLPSGKFATNDLVLACAVLAYNILRWIGLEGLTGPGSPIRHAAKRRRLRTVMQELMYVAARVVESGRRMALKFSSHCPAFPSFEAVYAKLASG